MKLKMMIMLAALLLYGETCCVGRETMLIERKDGGSILTNDPTVASGALSVKPVGKTEVMIFPTRSHRSGLRPRAERILTGIFSGHEDDESVLMPEEEPYTPVSRHRVPARAKTAETISWIDKSGTAYHDPFLECAAGSDRLWVDNVQDLCGLAPCDECFIKTAHVPEFISKESGGLDLASASALLTNQEFLAWAVERLPIKNPGFISTRRLLIYPKMEMTNNGLEQLAKEVEIAYRRHTWRVIEVVVKKSETDTDDISSFGEESGNGSTDD
ncbi:MAG: hypothetical protein ACD_39C00443G0004 [uncultured bacterium]|nr:MAG: hypothetical protein ACD_39C00443G0004 [uncultured bacterium]